MNDVSETAKARPEIVRPRDAASLILMRGHGRTLELLAGRRPAHVKFMPGIYVFPGGSLDPEDRSPWHGETGAGDLPPRLARCARAALRETWEEVGVLVGRRVEGTASEATPAGFSPVERAYATQGVVPALDVLTYIGRAITPTRVFRRFNTRFFLADAEAVFGDPAVSDELEDVAWHPIGQRELAPFRDVTQFMLTRAIAVREGNAPAEVPLFYTSKGKRRFGVCREAVIDL